MQDTDDLFPIGRIRSPHGLRGELKVSLFSGSAETLSMAGSVLLRNTRGETVSHVVASVKGEGKKTILALDGFNDINQVLPLVGTEILVRRSQFPALDEDEFFWCDLKGLTVVTSGGETLGRIDDLIVTGSNDVYVVRSGEREYLVPAIDGIVLEVDLERGIMVVDPVEGLLEL